MQRTRNVLRITLAPDTSDEQRRLTRTPFTAIRNSHPSRCILPASTWSMTGLPLRIETDDYGFSPGDSAAPPPTLFLQPNGSLDLIFRIIANRFPLRFDFLGAPG